MRDWLFGIEALQIGLQYIEQSQQWFFFFIHSAIEVIDYRTFFPSMDRPVIRLQYRVLRFEHSIGPQGLWIFCLSVSLRPERK